MNIPDFTGTLLGGRYELGRRIGFGGMATVYAAVDRQIDKPVAVKVLNPQFFHNQDYIARFRQEAFSAAKIRHPQLVDVTDFGHEEGLAYFVMELLEGESLSERLHRVPGAMPWTEAVAIVGQVCEALAYAHDRGVIHRDVKPGNIFLVAQPGRPGVVAAKLLDLGIAKVLREALELRAAAPDTRLSQGTPGTPEYMAPEQAMGWEVDHRTDIYALGVTLYRMLTGHLPFFSPNSTFEVQRMHVELPPVALRILAPDARVPASVEALVLRALAKRPDERFGSARELADSLFEAQRAEFSPPLPEPFEERTAPFPRPERARSPGLPRLLSLAMVLSGLLISATVFMLVMLFEIPHVHAFASWLRGAGGDVEQPVAISLPELAEPFRVASADRPVGADEPASELSFAEPIDLYDGVSPKKTAEESKVSAEQPGGANKRSPPKSPGIQAPGGQAESYVRGKVQVVARQCKDPRTAVPTVFRIAYNLATGEIKVRPLVESIRSNCVRKALEGGTAKKFGTGVVEFSVTVKV